MCGIVGIINKNGKTVDFQILSRMAETLNHRGPDDEGHLIDGPVGFYHKRLSIIDLTTGRQPMTSGRCQRRLQRRDLQLHRAARGVEGQRARFQHHLGHRSHPAHVPRVRQRLREKAERHVRLPAARHRPTPHPRRPGPLRDQTALLFCDAETAFCSLRRSRLCLAHPAVKAEPNYDGVHDYLTFQYVLGDGTMFKNIHKLLPGALPGD